MEFKVHTEYSLTDDGHSMAIMSEDHQGNRAFVQRITLKDFPRYTAVPREEAFCLQDGFGQDSLGANSVRNFLQAMLDAAWEFGLRPKGMKDQKDEIAAVRYHLEDMRSLALK